MTRITSESSWLQRFWSAVVETSAAAVAVHYRAPWNRSAAR